MISLDHIKNLPGIKHIISILGIDKAIFYTALGVVWSAISGVLGIFFIVSFLTLSQQGYWYTFLSLGALATLAELGFTTIITQFISHEYAHLKEKNGKLFGDAKRIDRTISLIKFSFKFYVIVTIVAFILLSILGVIFLMYTTTEYFILMAWIFYSFTGAFVLLVSLFGAVLKGFNKVDTAQKIITIATFFSNVAMWGALYMGLSVWALGVGGIVNIVLSLLLFFFSSRPLWNQIFRSKVSGQYNWFKETIPLQWRYAISWTAGYFIFQFIVPVAMIYVGADMAGKLGLSFTIVRSVQAMANSWGVTKIPQFNMLVAKKNRSELDNLLNTIQKQSLSVYAAGTIATILIFIFIFPLINWSDRVLPLSEIIIILIAEGIHLIVFNWAYYLRSHKQEPYMKISVFSAILTALGIWLSFYLFSSTFIALCSYLVVQLITIIPARRIFIKKRKEYENDQIGY